MTAVVLVFVSRDASQYKEAATLAAAVGGRLVDRLANNLEDLKLVAAHRVVEPVVVVALVEGRTVMRIPRLVSAEELLHDLHRIA